MRAAGAKVASYPRLKVRCAMTLLVFLVHAFVNTFGITQPTPEGARRAARYVGVVLAVAFVLALAAAIELRTALRPS